jgi:N-acetylmuramic acid 6-phosphate etherase
MSPRNLDLDSLTTEQRNPGSAQLDTMSALEIAQLINEEDQTVAEAVERAVPNIARAMDAAAASLARGGRLIYVGAGSSGRIAALDASECAPTFNSDPKAVQYVIAGGEKALSRADELREDSRRDGERDLARRKPGKKDVVVGIAASGRTPYTVAALELARKRGATTVALVCSPNSPLEQVAHIPIVVEVGPEVVTGSTRMKAGTAQKMALNMISTGAMARLGYVYGNLMVNVHTRNQKLVERGLRVLMQAGGLGRNEAERFLQDARGSVALALVMARTGLTRPQAEKRLKQAGGHVRRATLSR